jgi:hypothetical protein
LVFGPLAKVFIATESAEKMSFKSLISKVSVRSVAVLNSLMQEVNSKIATIGRGSSPLHRSSSLTGSPAPARIPHLPIAKHPLGKRSEGVHALLGGNTI